MLNWNDDKTINEILYTSLTLATAKTDQSLIGEADQAARNAIYFCQQTPPVSGSFTQIKNAYIFKNVKHDNFGGVNAAIEGFVKITPSNPIIREDLEITLTTVEMNLTIEYLEGNEFIQGDKNTWLGRITTTTVKPHTQSRLINAQQASKIRLVNKSDQLVVYSQTKKNRFAMTTYTLTDFESAQYSTLDQNDNKINWLSTKAKLHVKNSPVGTYEVSFDNQEHPFMMDIHFPISGHLEIKDQNTSNLIRISADENAKRFNYQVFHQGKPQDKMTKDWENFLGWESEIYSIL